MEKPPPLAPHQQRALGRLKKVPGIEAFYLAGGTAIALHLRHRQSIDLDFFSVGRDVDLDRLREAIVSSLPEAEVLALSDATLRLRIEETPVDFVRYPYPLLEQAVPDPCGFPIASLRDLAAMKLAAISRRGIRRDFWDLFTILASGISLGEAGRAYVARFGVAEADLYHVLRALTYFVDADKETVFPAGLSEDDWNKVKAFFRREAPRLILDEPGSE